MKTISFLLVPCVALLISACAGPAGPAYGYGPGPNPEPGYYWNGTVYVQGQSPYSHSDRDDRYSQTDVNRTDINDRTVNDTTVNRTNVNDRTVDETNVNKKNVNKTNVNKAKVNKKTEHKPEKQDNSGTPPQ